MEKENVCRIFACFVVPNCIECRSESVQQRVQEINQNRFTFRFPTNLFSFLESKNRDNEMLFSFQSVGVFFL